MRITFGSLKILLCFFIVLFILPISVHAQVVINEFSSATSADWVELYAVEDTDINGWYLRDTASSVMKTISDSNTIGPSNSSLFVIEVSNRLNKTEDTIFLYNQKDQLIDEISYGGQENVCLPNENGSIGRYPDANSTWERLAVSTKGESNNEADLYPCPSPTPEPTKKPTSTPKPTKTTKPSNTSTPTINTLNESVNTDELDVLADIDDIDSEIEILKNQNVTKTVSDTKEIEKEVDVTDVEDETDTAADISSANNIFGVGMFMLGGLGFIGAASYPIIKKKGLLDVFNKK